jgi:hypothetical protein
MKGTNVSFRSHHLLLAFKNTEIPQLKYMVSNTVSPQLTRLIRSEGFRVS